MRRLPVFLSLMLVVNMLLAGCAPGEEETPTPREPSTAESTAAPVATEPGTTEPAAVQTLAVTETPAASEAPAATAMEVLPPTGGLDPGRLSVLRGFEVCSQAGQQIGDAHDFVIDRDNQEIDYVVVDTSRFEEVGKRIAVPWESVEARPDNGDGRVERCEDVFLLMAGQEVFANAPQLNLNSFPEIGAPAAGWDADVVTYWESGGTVGAGTPAAGAATPEPTATQTTGTPGAGQASATPGVEATPGATRPAGERGLLGVVRARQLVGYRLAGEDGSLLGSIQDALVDITTGKIMYVVVEVRTAAGETLLIAVPLQALRWDPTALSFGLMVDRATLEAAPAFEGQEIPDTQASGWDAEIQSYWSQFVEGLGGS